MSDRLTYDEQQDFARFLRGRLPKPEGAKWHAIHALTEFSAAVLDRPVLHWRDLDKAEARTVLKAAAEQYPHPK